MCMHAGMHTDTAFENQSHLGSTSQDSGGLLDTDVKLHAQKTLTRGHAAPSALKQ